LVNHFVLPNSWKEEQPTSMGKKNHLILWPKFFGSCQQVFRLNTNPCPHFFNPLYHKTILNSQKSFLPKIKWYSSSFCGRLWTQPKPQTFFQLVQIGFLATYHPLYLVVLMIWYLKFWMVYFHLEDFASGFFQLFQLCSRITHGHIYVHQCIAHVLGAICFLNMAKPSLGFVQFFLEKHYVTSLITPYAFNFMIHFKTFYPPPPIGCHNWRKMWSNSSRHMMCFRFSILIGCP
jgi:hypothetical protein